MALLTNSLEGVTPSGTTLTAGVGGNTGGTSGSFLDVVTIGTGATLASDSTHAAHGGLSAKVATSGTAATSFVAWTTSMGSQATVWFRLYLFITANPANVLRLFSALQGSTAVGALALTTTGLLRQLNSTGATIQTGAVAVPANQWVRIEGFITGSATVGQIEHKLFKTLDSTTADETLTSAASQSMTGAPDTYRFGLATSLASAGPYWLDDVGLSSTAYLGPAAIGRDQGATLISAGGTSLAITWPVLPTAGSKVLVALSPSNALTPTSVVDNGTTPATFTLDKGPGTGTNRLFIYRADNITLPATGSYTVTVTWPSASGGATGWGQSYLSVAAGGPTSSNSGAATSSSVSTGNATPAAAGALFFATFSDTSGANPETITLTGSGFTQQAAQTNGAVNVCLAAADKIDAAGPTATPCTWTLGDAPNWGAEIAAYDMAAGAANVTGVGAAVPVASPAGTPAGGANVTGLAAPVAVAAGVGTPAGSANVTGVAATVPVQSPAGTPSGGANVTGTAALVTVAAGLGTPSGGTAANTRIATSSPTVTAPVVSLASATDPRDGTSTVTGGAVTVVLGLLDEGGGQVLDEAGNPILDESGG